VQTLQAQTLLPIVAVQAATDKVARANMVAGVCQAHRVSIVAGVAGDMLLDELVRFPSAKHDDMVDAFVYALTKLMQDSQRWHGGIWA